MSFANLRSARQSKEARSFVGAGTDAGQAQDAPAQPGTRSTADGESMTVDPPAASQPDTRPPLVTDLPVTLPASLEARKSDASGRGVYAKEHFAPGAILLSVRPRVAVISTPNLDAYCSYCAGPAPESGLKRCTGCRTIRYCNAACQNSDWSIHKLECGAMQKWAAAAPSTDVAIPSDAVRCIGRMLWNMQKKGLDSAWTKELGVLQSHRASLQPSAFESHTHLAHFVVRYIGASSPADLAAFGLSSAADLVDLISRFTTNTFTLTSHSLTPIGVCVSPPVALVNHSCDPNAVIVFPRPSKSSVPEPCMQLIALKPVAPGEEILASYVDITLPTEVRRAALKETYNFLCKCTLCVSQVPTDPRESVLCRKACGGTCPLPTEENSLARCVKCKTAVSDTDAVLDAVRLGQEALDKATTVQFKDMAKAKQLTTNMVPILTSAGLAPSCHPLLAMTRLHQELLVASLGSTFTQEALDETIRAAAKYSTGLGSILTYGHPVRAVALAELGKLLAVDEPSPPEENAASAAQFPPHGAARLKLAYQTLVQARSELTIGFGKANVGGQLGSEIREILVRLEKELGVWTEGIRNALEDAQLSKAKAK